MEKPQRILHYYKSIILKDTNIAEILIAKKKLIELVLKDFITIPTQKWFLTEILSEDENFEVTWEGEEPNYLEGEYYLTISFNYTNLNYEKQLEQFYSNTESQTKVGQ